MKKVMRISTLRLGLLTIATGFMIMFTGCQQEDLLTQDANLNAKINQASAKAAGPSASGQGTLSLENIPIEGEKFRHFSFHANTQKDGSVKGSGVLTYAGGVRNLSFDINCLTVIGNHAIMSGVTTRDNQFPENEGLLCWFEVFDNGEGSNADADQMSLYYQGTDPLTYDCINDFAQEIYPIEGGNIQVKE